MGSDKNGGRFKTDEERERYNAYMRKYRAEHKEQFRQYRKNYERNKTDEARQRCNEYQRRYRAAHKDDVRRWRVNYIMRTAERMRQEIQAQAVDVTKGEDTNG